MTFVCWWVINFICAADWNAWFCCWLIRKSSWAFATSGVYSYKSTWTVTCVWKMNVIFVNSTFWSANLQSFIIISSDWTFNANSINSVITGNAKAGLSWIAVNLIYIANNLFSGTTLKKWIINLSQSTQSTFSLNSIKSSFALTNSWTWNEKCIISTVWNTSLQVWIKCLKSAAKDTLSLDQIISCKTLAFSVDPILIFSTSWETS